MRSRWVILGGTAAVLACLGGVLAIHAVDSRSAASHAAVVADAAPVNEDTQNLVDRLAGNVELRTGTRPTTATVFATTHGAAVDAVDANDFGIAKDAPTNVVVFDGKFSLVVHHGPSGSNAPLEGTTIVYVIDGSTQQTGDFGLLPKAPDVSALGHGTVVRVSDKD